MATIKTTIQLRRDIATNWEKVANTFIPKIGEPCITLVGDKSRLKIGDGVHNWGALQYVGENVDGLSVILNESDGISYITLNGFLDAEDGMYPIKQEGELTWVKSVPASTVNVDDKTLKVVGTGDDAVIAVAGWNSANIGTSPSKTVDGFEWKTFTTEEDVDNKIKSQVSTLYKYAGSILFANLPQPSADTVGNVYNIKDQFTTTDKFLEGAGEKYDAGSNIAIISYVDTSVDPAVTDYMYDVFASPLDVAGIADQVTEDIASLFSGKMVTDVAQPVIDATTGNIQLKVGYLEKVENGEVTSTVKDVIFHLATDTSSGIMSKEDKAKLDSIGDSTITAIKAGTQEIIVTDGVATIPIATDQALGVVKSSDINNMVEVNADGTMEVVSIGVSKLTQSAEEELILNGGSSVI